MTEAQQRELLLKMEALVNDSEASRKAIRDGIADLGVRLARLETKFDGGIITVDLCNEREKAVNARLDAEERARETGDLVQEKRLDGHVIWMRLIGVGIVLALAGAIIGVALR
jgi:hypothetical protein